VDILIPSLIIQVSKTRMGRLSGCQVCSRETASLLADEIIKLVGRCRTERVILVGCQNIELLVQLAHGGFLDVTCRSALNGPNAGEMSADIIIVPAVDRQRELPMVLSRLSRSLCSGGIILLSTSSSQSETCLRRIQRVLRQHGFEIVGRHHESGDFDVLCGRKVPLARAKAA
jgi:hypothetical protein